MIKHILKIIWIERKTNLWILLELILVFCILWFCTDYLYFTGKRYLEPRGFDIEHVYQIEIEMNNEGRKKIQSGTDEEQNAMLNDIWTILDRVKAHPAIEAASYSNSAIPYSDSYSWNEFLIDSTTLVTRQKTIDLNFFKVFKIDMISGTPFTEDNIVGDRPPVIVSGDREDMFGPKKATAVDYISYSDGSGHKVLGTAEKLKENEYEDYSPTVYFPLKRDSRNIMTWREMTVRVKPNADKNFAEQFIKDMQSRLEVGHYFLVSVQPLEKQRERYMEYSGYSGSQKSVLSVTGFLIVNIFLGIIGTFWFRTQSRRNEIGLRMAMGSSKRNVQFMFIGETLLLLFLSSVVASIICLNITMVDILKDIGIPSIDRSVNETGGIQHLINYGITFLFLSVVAVVAVWYPAMRASKIQPADALHDE